MLSYGVCLLHNNAPVHMVAVAKPPLKEVGFQENKHPSYSPDLASND
jgi:hypothetical protein